MAQNLRNGVTQDFTGFFEETKEIAMPITDKNGDDVSLVGAAITMSVKRSGSSTTTVYTLPDSVLTGIDGNSILMDWTTFVNSVFKYEIKVVLADGWKFINDGTINITNTV